MVEFPLGDANVVYENSKHLMEFSFAEIYVTVGVKITLGKFLFMPHYAL